MKKRITTILSLLMVLSMSLGLTGCGGEEKVPLSSKTVNGLTFNVPDDFSDFTETQEVMLSTNEESTASIVVSKELELGIMPAEVTKEYYTKTIIPNFTDVNFIEFKTDVEISYTTAVYVHFTAKKADGLEVESHAYLIGIPVDDGDDMMQSVMFSFTKDSNNSLKASIDDIKSSMKFE